jgi:putative transposase
MGSVIRRMRKRKRCLGEVRVLRREEYQGLELNAKVEAIRSLIPLGLMHVQMLLEEEVEVLAGPRYARDDGASGMRYGSNPGTVQLDGQKIAIRVPRVRSERGELPLRSYQGLHGSGEADDALLRRVFYGISCRNYEAAARAIPGAIGLSSSSVSRGFVTASAAQLKEFQERELSKEHYVAVFLDGKSFADATLVIALGVAADGTKRFLGFVETDTENDKVLAPFLRSLIERGLDLSQGLLVVIDGGKGLRSAVRQVFQKRAVVQRCMWHKRENVVSYLPKSEQASWRRRLQLAYDRPTYTEAKAALTKLHRELEGRNQSAAASLAEGLEETLTLHRLGIYALLGVSFKTTNCIESTNGLVEERCAKVDVWKTSNQRHRWLATALLDIEPRLRRVKGHRHLPKLEAALRRTLNIKEQQQHRMEEAA